MPIADNIREETTKAAVSTRGSNILDLVLITNKHSIGHVSVMPPFLNSDRNSVVITMCSTFKMRDLIGNSMNFYAADYGKTGSALALINWEYLF